MSLTLTSCLESAERAETRVVDFSQQSGCSDRQLHEIGLAVREAVANAVLHGNRCDSKKKVHLKAAVQQGVLEIWIQDEGEGFDFLCVDTSFPEEPRSVRQRGYVLICRVATSLEFNERGNRVTVLVDAGARLQDILASGSSEGAAGSMAEAG